MFDDIYADFEIKYENIIKEAGLSLVVVNEGKELI